MLDELLRAFSDRLRRLSTRVFGKKITNILAVVVVVGIGGWWRWSDLMQLPGVSDLIGATEERLSLPHANAGSFSVAVAPFVGDSNDALRSMFIDDLHGLKFLDVLRIDVPVGRRDVGHQDKSSKQARDRGIELLHRTGADVLVWGEVFDAGGKQSFRAHFVSDVVPDNDVTGARLPMEDYDFPPITQLEFRRVLTLATINHLDLLSGNLDKEWMPLSQIKSLIGGIKSLLQDERRQLTPKGTAELYYVLAKATQMLIQYGSNPGDDGELQFWAKNATIFYMQKSYPEIWASLMEISGISALNVGCMESSIGGERQVADLATAFGQLSTLYKYDLTRQDHSMMISDLNNKALIFECFGRTAVTVGEPEEDIPIRIAALHVASDIFGYVSRIIDSGSLSNIGQLGLMRLHAYFNVAATESLLGQSEEDLLSIDNATHYLDLAARTPEAARDPIELGKIYSEQGVDYLRRGNLTRRIADYSEGLRAEQEFFSVIPREIAPRFWAMAMGNTGHLQLAIGRCSGDEVALAAGYESLKQAQQEFEREGDGADATAVLRSIKFARSSRGRQDCS